MIYFSFRYALREWLSVPLSAKHQIAILLVCIIICAVQVALARELFPCNYFHCCKYNPQFMSMHYCFFVLLFLRLVRNLLPEIGKTKCDVELCTIICVAMEKRIIISSVFCAFHANVFKVIKYSRQ